MFSVTFDVLPDFSNCRLIGNPFIFRFLFPRMNSLATLLMRYTMPCLIRQAKVYKVEIVRKDYHSNEQLVCLSAAVTR